VAEVDFEQDSRDAVLPVQNFQTGGSRQRVFATRRAETAIG
jgi:hypothetical protein